MSTSDSDDVLATDISQWTRGEKARYQAREALDEELEEQEAPEHEDLEQAEVDVEIRVTIPVDFDRDEYTDNTNAALCVRAIAGEASVQGQKVYKVLFEDGHIEKVCLRATYHILSSPSNIQIFLALSVTSRGFTCARSRDSRYSHLLNIRTSFLSTTVPLRLSSFFLFLLLQLHSSLSSTSTYPTASTSLSLSNTTVPTKHVCSRN